MRKGLPVIDLTEGRGAPARALQGNGAQGDGRTVRWVWRKALDPGRNQMMPVFPEVTGVPGGVHLAPARCVTCAAASTDGAIAAVECPGACRGFAETSLAAGRRWSCQGGTEPAALFFSSCRPGPSPLDGRRRPRATKIPRRRSPI